VRSRPPQPRNPLQPVSGTLRLLLRLTLLAIAGFLLVPQQNHWTGPVCSRFQSYSGFPGKPGMPEPPISDTVPVGGLVRGSYVKRSDLIQVCADHPGWLLRMAGVVDGIPWLVLLLGGIILGRRVIQSAGRPGGLYAPETARRVLTLGRFLVAGSVIGWVVTTGAQVSITWSQVHGMGFIPVGSIAGVPFTSLLLGVVMLTLARVMRVGVAMRDELDATV
jgi:Protein of unknown function (DUF2975)